METDEKNQHKELIIATEIVVKMQVSYFMLLITLFNKLSIFLNKINFLKYTSYFMKLYHHFPIS